MRKIEYLEDLIQDKKDQIQHNKDEAKKSNRPLFYTDWNRDLSYEIEAFELLIKKEKNDL